MPALNSRASRLQREGILSNKDTQVKKDFSAKSMNVAVKRLGLA